MNKFRRPTEYRSGYVPCPFARGVMHNTSLRQLLILLMMTFSISMPRLTALPIQEKQIQSEEPTQAIVSLSPNVTETLYALGVGNLLVGRSDYCNYPEEALSLPSVGTLYNPSLEKLLSLEPTLVISSAFVSEGLLASIRQAGIDVLSLHTDQSVQGTYALIRGVADAVGRQKEAELMILNMQNEVRTVFMEAQNKHKKTVYVVLDFASFDATATGDTFLGEMIELAGGINIAKDATNWTYSKELLMHHDPEIILLSPRWGERGEQTLAEFTSTKPYADLQGDIRLFDADLVSRQGPRTAEALALLYDLIHQESKE